MKLIDLINNRITQLQKWRDKIEALNPDTIPLEKQEEYTSICDRIDELQQVIYEYNLSKIEA